jgi:hypothetical protein
MNLVFAADSIWNWEAEKNYRILMEENPGLVQAARRGSAVVDPETGLPKPDAARKSSLVPHGEGRRPSLVTADQEKRKGSLIPNGK